MGIYIGGVGIQIRGGGHDYAADHRHGHLWCLLKNFQVPNIFKILNWGLGIADSQCGNKKVIMKNEEIHAAIRILKKEVQ